MGPVLRRHCDLRTRICVHVGMPRRTYVCARIHAHENICAIIAWKIMKLLQTKANSGSRTLYHYSPQTHTHRVSLVFRYLFQVPQCSFLYLTKVYQLTSHPLGFAWHIYVHSRIWKFRCHIWSVEGLTRVPRCTSHVGRTCMYIGRQTYTYSTCGRASLPEIHVGLSLTYAHPSYVSESR